MTQSYRAGRRVATATAQSSAKDNKSLLMRASHGPELVRGVRECWGVDGTQMGIARRHILQHAVGPQVGLSLKFSRFHRRTHPAVAVVWTKAAILGR